MLPSSVPFLRRLGLELASRDDGPQGRIVTCGRGRAPGRLRIDLAVAVGGALLVAGWRTPGVRLALETRGADGAWCGLGHDDAAHGLQSFAVPRPDVAQHLGLPEDGDLGVAWLVDPAPEGPLRLAWCHGVDGLGGHRRLKVARPRLVGERPSAEGAARAPRALPRLQALPALDAAGGEAIVRLARRWPAFSAPWCALLAAAPDARSSAAGAGVAGHLENVLLEAASRDGVATGWLGGEGATGEDGTPLVWLQDAAGRVQPWRPAARHAREDASRALAAAGLDAGSPAGFVAVVEGLAPGRVRLRALTAHGVVALGECVAEALPAQPLAAARRLVQCDPTSPLMPARLAGADTIVLAAAAARHASLADGRAIEVLDVGALPEAPFASVVVAVHGRPDLVEHQVLAFADDPAFSHRVELVIVVDDPRLAPEAPALARRLEAEWGVPARWVCGGAARGAAGARNLGARHALGRHLVFLDPGTFPVRAGWVERLCAPLEADASVGATGPRLLDAQGGLHHAGLAWRWRGDLGLWVDHPAGRGLPPAHDPHGQAAAAPVEALSGACLALRRETFDTSGGWDTGYLGGDLAGSDLCLRLQARGLRTLYLPGVELTHLERLSPRAGGDERLRRYVALHDALRVQGRWPGRFGVDDRPLAGRVARAA